MDGTKGFAAPGRSGTRGVGWGKDQQEGGKKKRLTTAMIGLAEGGAKSGDVELTARGDGPGWIPTAGGPRKGSGEKGHCIRIMDWMEWGIRARD